MKTLLAACCTLGLIAALSAVTAPAIAQTSPPPPDYSAAERLLLMSDQMQRVSPPATLSYRFQHGGTLDAPFEDKVNLQFTRLADGRCCTATGEFLTGPRRLTLPQVEQVQGNPVTLYFLERDIREMQRLTKGQASYFRKRIRMALYQGARLGEARFSYRGQSVAGQEIVIQPYLDDPNRARFEHLAHKQYRFLLSDAVPGRVVSIHTTTRVDGGPAPLVEEALWIDGATPPIPSASAALTRPQPVRP